MKSPSHEMSFPDRSTIFCFILCHVELFFQQPKKRPEIGSKALKSSSKDATKVSLWASWVLSFLWGDYFLLILWWTNKPIERSWCFELAAFCFWSYSVIMGCGCTKAWMGRWMLTFKIRHFCCCNTIRAGWGFNLFCVFFQNNVVTLW